MTNYSNLAGTSSLSFQISLSGPILYQGQADPTVTPPTGSPNRGDLYIRHGSANQIWSFNGAVWEDNSTTFTGGTVSGDLDVSGQIASGGQVFLLNDGEAGSGVSGGFAGLEVDRGPIDPNAEWVFNEANDWWTPAGFTDTIHSTHMVLEPGLVPALTFTGDTSTGIYSSAAGTMALATGANVWTINATGDLIPTGGGTQNVGDIANHSASIYSGRFFADPAGSNPQITYFGDDDTGIGHPAPNTLSVITDSKEVLRFQSNGLLVVDNAAAIPGGYETLVSAGGSNSVPNKQWVLDVLPTLLYELQTGLVGAPLIILTVVTYNPGLNDLVVYLNGQKMLLGTNYTEPSGTTVQWVGPPLVATDVVEFYTSIVAASPKNQYEEFVGTAVVASVLNTTIPTASNVSGGVGKLQVFVNGVLQQEGAAKNYTVTGTNQITFNVTINAADDIVMYAFN